MERSEPRRSTADAIVSLTYELGGVPVEMLTPGDWRKAIEKGRVRRNTPLTVYRESSTPQVVAAADVPEIRAVFDAVDPPAADPAAAKPLPLAASDLPVSPPPRATGDEAISWQGGFAGAAQDRAVEHGWADRSAGDRSTKHFIIGLAGTFVLLLLVGWVTTKPDAGLAPPRNEMTTTLPPAEHVPDRSARSRRAPRPRTMPVEGPIAPSSDEGTLLTDTPVRTPPQPSVETRASSNTRRPAPRAPAQTSPTPRSSALTCVLPSGEAQLDYQECRRRGGVIYR